MLHCYPAEGRAASKVTNPDKRVDYQPGVTWLCLTLPHHGDAAFPTLDILRTDFEASLAFALRTRGVHSLAH